jgi:glycosyltransferase involved in cell wall biosynthesis
LRWQLDTALERGVAGTCIFSWTDDWCVAGVPVEGWHFGLTDRDRRERPALETAARANQRTVRDLDVAWPSISVVVCAYNAGTTLDECLEHTCALDYPDLEVLVVDDGSTDDTAAIVRRHPRATLVQIVHAGLSAARNEGLRSARGDLIAYLDADAYPTPEWPYFLALGMDRPEVGGVGGPNVGPASDGRAASVVAAAPGGPVHVLISDSVAEHVPGCNMAFRKDVLLAVGGFDPVFEAAGDDVDLCWRVIDRGWTIGFHPAALVWHHRRSGLLAYLRQQRGYGRSEALVEARHPNRFTRLGTARWKGRIYQAQTVRSSIQRVYRGPFGTAAYQSVYAAGGDALDLVHQAGVPLAMLLVVTLPLGVLERWLAAPAGVAVVALLALMVFDAGRATTRRIAGSRSLTFGLRVALHQLLQPVVRTWARNGARRAAFRGLAAAQPTPTPVAASRAGVAVFEDDRPRAEFAAALLDGLRTSGTRSFVATAWQDHDGTVLLSPLVRGELLTSSHPIGYVQVRIRAKLRWVRVLVASSVGVALLPAVPVLSAVVLGVCGVMTTLGLVRSRTTLAGLVGKPAI